MSKIQGDITIAGRHPEYIFVDAVGILAAKVARPEELARQYPVSSKIAMRTYSKVIQKRPLFLLMVDPTHPNAVGFEIIAQALARAIAERGGVTASVAERMRYTDSLQKIRAVGGGFSEFTAVERRAAQMQGSD